MNLKNSVDLLLSTKLGEDCAIPPKELLEMAGRNARKLEHNLDLLLEMAEMQTGWVRTRLSDVAVSGLLINHPAAKRVGMRISQSTGQGGPEPRILADPRKLSRALELTIFALEGVGAKDIEVISKPFKIEITGKLSQKELVELEEDIAEGNLAALAGMGLPTSSFGKFVGGLDVLARTKEGIGSEWIVIVNLLKVQKAKIRFTRSHESADFAITLEFNKPEGRDALIEVMRTRITRAIEEAMSVSLVLIQSSGMDGPSIVSKVREALFRTTDCVMEIPEKGLVAVLLDDCPASFVGGLTSRLGAKLGGEAVFGAATCPDLGYDPENLFDEAIKEL